MISTPSTTQPPMALKTAPWRQSEPPWPEEPAAAAGKLGGAKYAEKRRGRQLCSFNREWKPGHARR